MFECSTKIDVSVQKQLNKRLFMLSLILIIFGAIGSIAYIVLSTLNYEWSVWLVAFCIPLGVGIGYLWLINKNIKFVSTVSMENIYCFEKNFFNVKILRNGEEVANSKIYYKDLIKIKECGNYMFLFINHVYSFPVDKTKLKEDELILLQAFLKNSKNS